MEGVLLLFSLPFPSPPLLPLFPTPSLPFPWHPYPFPSIPPFSVPHLRLLLPPLHSFPIPFPPLPLEVNPLNQLWDLGEYCKLCGARTEIEFGALYSC